MTLNDWYTNLESKIFTIVKARLKKSYADAVFVTIDENNTKTKFPSVLIKEMDGYEQGMDLQGETINALLYTMQITVTSDKTKKEATKIMSDVIPIMKSLRFTLVSLPVVLQDTNKYYSVARFRRMIGSGDTDLVSI